MRRKARRQARPSPPSTASSSTASRALPVGPSPARSTGHSRWRSRLTAGLQRDCLSAEPGRQLGLNVRPETTFRYPGCQLGHRPGEGRRVDPVRARGRIASDTERAPAQQGHRAPDVSPLGMRQAHRNLGQPPPQAALTGRCRTPGRLEHLVSMKRPAGIKVALRSVESLGGSQVRIVGRSRLASGLAVQRAPELVARPGIPGPASGVPVPLHLVPLRLVLLLSRRAHRSGSGSASQARSSASKRSGRSSCGKCPAPSRRRHR